MAIITISRGSFSHGKEIAEKVAGLLGYECISREILLEASKYFRVPEMKLLKSIHDAPSILERFTHGKEKYISYIRAALLDHIKQDNVVYHGHAGHLLIPEIDHVLKVRVIADTEERIFLVQQQKGVSREEALQFLTNEDRHRALWTRYLYGVDIEDPRLYDLIINIGGLKIENACEIISDCARSAQFATTPESRRAIGDLAIVSHVQAALQDVCTAEVAANDGVVHVRVAAQKLRRTGYASPKLQMEVKEQIRIDLAREIIQVVQDVPGVKDVVCDVETPYYT